MFFLAYLFKFLGKLLLGPLKIVDNFFFFLKCALYFTELVLQVGKLVLDHVVLLNISLSFGKQIIFYLDLLFEIGYLRLKLSNEIVLSFEWIMRTFELAFKLLVSFLELLEMAF